MSHHSSFSMVVFDPRDGGARQYLSSNAFADLLGVPADDPAMEGPPLRRYLYGMTRSDWVKDVSAKLFDAAGSFDSLRFISEQTYTHREFVVGYGAKPADPDPYGNDLKLTLFAPSELATLIVDVERFIRWCANNVPLVLELIECDGEGAMLDAIYRTRARVNPTDLDDEGQGGHSLICTLKSVRELLVHARRFGLSAVYVNDQFTSLEWYRESLGPVGPADGRLHKNPQHVRPTPSRQPLQPFPPAGLPIDLPALVAALTAEEREKLKLIRPYWAGRDRIDYLFQQETTLLETGRVVWAALIQVNKTLFEPIYCFGAPGEVVFDPAGRMSREGLLDEAGYIVRLKGNKLVDGELRFFALHLEDERERIFGKAWNTEGYALEVSSIYFDQLHLPDGMVTLPYFPVIVSDRSPGAVMVLPWRLWPPDFTEEWMAVSEKKFRVRHSSEALRAAAVARGERTQAEFDADPAPFNLNPTSLYEEGLLYFHGRGVLQDYSRARALWEKAARFGHPESMNNLGIVYGNGLGVPEDARAAFEWFRRCADKGHPLGELNLGRMYLLGVGVDADAGLARSLLERSARQGNEEAVELLLEHGLLERGAKEGGVLNRLIRKWRQ